MTIDEMMADIKRRLEVIEDCLPREIDLVGISRAKLPSKIVWYRESLIWRLAELVRTALEAFERGKLGAAVVLTRAGAESNAALWYLEEKVTTALTNGDVGDLDECVNRLLFGNFTWEDFPNPIRVGKFVDSVERRIPGAREQYHVLSEYAHPNAAGTESLFSLLDRQNLRVSFGLDKNEAGVKAARAACVANLDATLIMFEDAYNKLSDGIIELVKLCESQVPLTPEA